MSLISRLILGPAYSAHDLYVALRLDGESNRNLNGGLGDIIKGSATLIRAAFTLDARVKNNKLISIKDVREIYNLAQAYRNNKPPARHQNYNKYAICLALVYREIIATGKQLEQAELLGLVTSELLKVLGVGGELQSLVMPTGDKARVLQQLRGTLESQAKLVLAQPVVLSDHAGDEKKAGASSAVVLSLLSNTVTHVLPDARPMEGGLGLALASGHVGEAIAVEHGDDRAALLPLVVERSDRTAADLVVTPALVVQPVLDDRKQDGAVDDAAARSALDVHPRLHVDDSAALRLAPLLVERKELDAPAPPSPRPAHVEFKATVFIEGADRINRALTVMQNEGKDDITIPGKKGLERKGFEREIKQDDWKLEELVALLQYMFQVQNGTAAAGHPFATIRTEQAWIIEGHDGNTRTWQDIMHGLKQRVIKALTDAKAPDGTVRDRLVLSDREYNKYHRLLGQHTARIFGWGRTDSVIDFENLFMPQSEANVRTHELGYMGYY
jgi:hypothetical protein